MDWPGIGEMNLILLGVLIIVVILFLLFKYKGKITRMFSVFGVIIGVIVLFVGVMLAIWFLVISPLNNSILNGNILKAFLVISVLGMAVYTFIIFIISLAKYEKSYYEYRSRAKLHVIIFMITMAILSIWFFYIAIDITEFLYLPEESDPLRYIIYNTLEEFPIYPLHFIFGAISGITLIFFSIELFSNKPFLKIARYWKWMHNEVY
jgi:hypothetical protein